MTRQGKRFQDRLFQSLEAHGSQPAVEYGPRTLSYRELGRRADAVHGLMAKKGVAKGTFIGILTEDRLDLIAIMVGVLKAGCVIVPLHSGYPDQRLEAMMSSTHVKYVFIDKTNFQRFKDSNDSAPADREFIFIGRLPQEAEEAGLPEVSYHPDDPVYVYFTSGTTGVPKAIVGRNKGLRHYMDWEIETLGMGPGFRVSQFTIPAFDPYLRDVFAPLLSGGVICIPEDKDIILDAAALKEWVERQEITQIHCVPSVFRLLSSGPPVNEEFKHLKYILLHGEKTNPSDLVEWYRVFGKRIQLVNCYGPTETTLCKIHYFIQPEDVKRERIPIGQPMPGSRVIIMDRDMRACDELEPGEIYIRTPFRGLGYYNNEQMNRDRFIPNPFSDNPADVIYRTGDLGRLLTDGNIDILGRVDRQVKLRGQRIELEEVETVMAMHVAVKEAVVIKKEMGADREFLCGYFTLNTGDAGGQNRVAEELKDHIGKQLPHYMVPAHMVEMPELPRRANGKVDYDNLPDPLVENVEAAVQPRGEVEQRLLDIWREFFPGMEIGVTHNFFKMGGNSLNIMMMISRIHGAFDKRLSLGDVFLNPTIEKQALLLGRSDEQRYAAISPAPEQEYYVLSPAQKRLYVLQRLDLESTAYNLPQVVALEEPADRERLEDVFHRLIRRHESLRTSFYMVGVEPVQQIHAPDETGFAMSYYDTAEGGVDAIIESFVRPFALDRPPLFRAGLIETGDKRHILIVDMHHIISDGTSLGLLIREFLELYEGREPLPLTLQYKDYACWLNDAAQREAVERQAAYWLAQYPGEIPVLNVPLDFNRPVIQSTEGAVRHFNLGVEETAALSRLAKQEGATFYMVLLAIYTVFLAKISGQEDMVVGTPVAGRRHEDLKAIIGMFVNTLAIRTFPHGHKTFRDYLKEVRKQAADAFENQDYPFEDLVENISVNRDTSRNPLFDVMFVLEDMEVKDASPPDLKARPYLYENTTAKFDMTLFAVRRQELLFSLEYCTRLFKPDTIGRFTEYFKRVAGHVSKDPDRLLSSLEIISEAEKQRLLEEYNDTVADYPRDKTLVHFFEDRVERFPGQVALEGRPVAGGGDESPTRLSYHELDQQAGQLARVLKSKGVGPGMITAIQVERSVEMVVGLLGIFKAGGAYLPISPDCPEDRKRYMLEDSRSAALMNLGADGTIVVEDQASVPAASAAAGPDAEMSPGRLAYVLYTSGSTGAPKGVMVEHRSIVNTLVQLERLYPLTSNDAFLLKTHYTFDVSLTELFGWFMGKGKLAVLDAGKESDPAAIVEALRTYGVTHINFVPSMFGVFLDSLSAGQVETLSSLKYIFLAGEALPPRLVRASRELGTGIRLENIYGPTEAAIYASKYSLSQWREGEPVLIGKPIANTRLYILNRGDQIQPTGIPGELYIAGAGVARGYLNQVELTAAAFRTGGITGGASRRGERVIYKTGDLARWLPDGSIEYLGRIDTQVKVRGFRIEPGEVENHLLAFPGVREALVVTHEAGDGRPALCAYLAVEHSADFSVPDLRDYLTGKLPSYMVPGYFTRLESLPLTSGGKVDISALPEPDDVAVSGGYTAPRNNIEKTLAAIWSEILGIAEDRVGIDLHFFQAGGHSLTAVVMASRIHKRLNARLAVTQIFKTPAIRGLAKVIEAATRSIYDSIQAVEEREYYPLSSAQQRMFLLNRLKGGGTSDNTPCALWVKGPLDVERLDSVIRRLIRRHEALRTSFEMINDQPAQRVRRQVDFSIIQLEERLASTGSNDITALIDGFVRPFDLGRAPLMRVGLMKPSGPEPHYLLLYDMHHIISDGTSLETFHQEFVMLYQGVQLRPLQIQYKDYACWQRDLTERGTLREQERYWLNVFSEEPPALDLPADFPRPAEQSFEGDYIEFKLEKEIVIALRELAVSNGATLYMALLSVYTILLYKYTGQEDIVVGSSSAGRPHADLQNVMGFFVNTLAMRNRPRGHKTFNGFLDEVKQNALHAYENQEYQFDDLVKGLGLQRKPDRQVLFDTHFTLHKIHVDRDAMASGMTDLVFEPYLLEEKTTQFDIIIHAQEVADEVRFTLRYSNKLFKRDTIERFADYFKEISVMAVKDNTIKIDEIKISHQLESARANMPRTDFIFA
jgi:tyrocidine synthetase-3